MAKKEEVDYEKKILEYKQKALKLQEKFEQSSKKTKGFVETMSNAFLGINFDDFHQSLSLSSQDIEKITSDLLKQQDVIKDLSSSFDTMFKNISSDTSIKNLLKEVKKDSKLASSEIGQALMDAIKNGNVSEFLKEFGDEGIESFERIIKSSGYKKYEKFLTEDVNESLKEAIKYEKELGDQIQANGKSVLDLSKGFNKIAENISSAFNADKIKNSVLEFDKSISEAQKNTGIAFKNNTEAMTALTIQTAEFGLSVKETSELMGKLGSGLRTTDFNVLSDAAKDMAAISNATGISIDDVGELGSQMMLFGKTSKDVSKFAESTMKSAMNFGVNGKKIMSDIVKNIPKFRQMGFQGGEESLKRMAIQAERLGQNIDEIFDVAKRARTIEGALNMAAELQLAGGSFANINPLDLLSAARKGPEELQKILSKMGADIGTFNEQTGQVDFGAVDIDRLQMVSDATGLSIDSLQKQITKTAQDAQKQRFLPPDLFSGLTEEEKAFLLGKINEKGELSVNVDGISDLTRLSKENIQTEMAAALKNKSTLEEQAKQNQSFEEALTNLKTSFMNVFTALEPLVLLLTKALQTLNSIPGWAKMIIAPILGLMALIFSSGRQFAAGFAFGKGQNAALQGGGFFKGFKDMISFKGGKVGGNTPDLGQNKESAGFLKSMGESLNAFPDMKKMLGIAAGIAAIGVAMIGIGVGIKFASEGLAVLVTSFKGLTGKEMLAALGAIALVMGGFVLMVGALGAVGAAAAPGILAVGVAFLMIGGGIALAAFGISLMVKSFSELSSSISTISSDGVAGLFALSAALGVLTLSAMAFANPFTVLGFGLMTAAIWAISEAVSDISTPLDKTSKSINSMVSGVTNLKSALKDLDVTNLEKIAEVSEKMSVASALSSVATAVSSIGSSSKKEEAMKIELKPIKIDLKLNGRDVQSIIVTDTKLLT